MKRIPTGLEKLDAQISGGIPEGFNVIISGKPGTAKSVMIHTLALNQLKAGYYCLFITTDRDKNQLLDEVPQFRPYYKKGKLIIIDAHSWKGMKNDGKHILASLANLNGLTIEILKIKEKLPKKQKVVICFDTLSEFFLWNDAQKMLRFIEIYCAKARIENTLGFYVVDEGVPGEKTLMTLESLTQVTIQMQEDEKQRFFTVDKIEATKEPTEKIFFDINDNGEVVLT
ncbi:hypothetical protein COT72_02005 [archaeon CG10_big_fil_rev_8_21_14_0_10_43_11]|nr:MAG: hypothetical protein COT72_02005 [archaeon CG10_big_fil_rev_8_21_14_0_10_43_11]